ncbi:hypothetical protein B0H14DRAFT_3488711 [Mycena olivaceomarginata]|nr:hypothetical protein B0H14DRAFT_3488711 [Mycena olivaceomarginata]
MDIRLIDPALRGHAKKQSTAMARRYWMELAITALSHPRLSRRLPYATRLEREKRNAPLAEACERLGIKTPKKASLPRLREELVNYWFPSITTNLRLLLYFYSPYHLYRCYSCIIFSPSPVIAICAASKKTFQARSTISTCSGGQNLGRAAPPSPFGDHHVRFNVLLWWFARGAQRRGVTLAVLSRAPTSAAAASPPVVLQAGPSRASDRNRAFAVEEDEDDEASLIKRYNIPGADAQDLLGYDDEEEEEDEEVDTSDEEAAHNAFQRSARVKAIHRAEGNRREGGNKTQKAMVKAWENITHEFKSMALKSSKIKDGVVDEHAILLFIEHNAEREKLDRRGQPIPGTRVGAKKGWSGG